jgi:hypothetical protein
MIQIENLKIKVKRSLNLTMIILLVSIDFHNNIFYQNQSRDV